MSTLDRVAVGLSRLSHLNRLVVVLPSEDRASMIAEWENMRGYLNRDLLPTHIGGVPFVFGETRDSFVVCSGFDGHPVIHML